MKGNMTHIDWKYFKEEETPEQQLVTAPLENQDGMPVYCSETLKWYEESWDVPEEEKNYFTSMSRAFYNMLYKVLTEGAPLEITPEQVRQQIA
ncbi:MAG: gfo/Idh/MocA family oxidoreductase, partial [Clostridiaceae bacterium]|nr:gfo/Idh/MocA family oxidoreductase [Clostridiaceae bacterium]